MIRIELLLFAQLRDRFGTERVSIEVPDGTTAEAAATELLAKSSDRDLARMPLMFAVNDDYVTADHELRDGDCVALITPFSGG